MILWFIGCQFFGAPAKNAVPAVDMPPTVALITIDTWRADHLTPDLTPAIWAMAEAGERYENAWSPMGLTTPAHATMFTGVLPWEHGTWANNHHGYALGESIPVLMESERYAGWAKGAFVSAYPAGPEGGLARGWDVFDGPESGERPGSIAVERALEWLPTDQATLLWVHIYEPHGPYEGKGATERARYAEEVAKADRIVAPLLAALGERNATIVVTSDHGEVLDEERCSYQHERSISDHVLKVPLVRWMPEMTPAVRAEWVGLTDVPALLAGESIGGRDHWVGQSGMCESDCAPGCSPAGLTGRDTVAIDPSGRRVNRPGRGRFSIGTPSDGLEQRLDAVPPVPPPSDAQTEQGRALGYIDPL